MGRPIKELRLPEKLPEWFKIMPDDATLSSLDLGHLLGVCRKTVVGRVEAGHLPRPDIVNGKVRIERWPGIFTASKAVQWKKSTIIKHFEGKQNG